MTKFRNREGLQAVNSENRTFEALQGTYVDNGVEVSTDGADMTLDVASGTVVQDNEEHGIGATTVTVPDNNEDNPRKDIVYVDDTQSVAVATGASDSPDPELEKVDSVFDTARPSPPSLVNQDDVVVLAEVWVEAGATEITSEDLEDRRLTLGLETGDTQNLTDTETIDAPITNNNELVDFEGPNLFVNQNGELEADAESAESDELATDATFVVYKDGTDYKVMNDNGNVAFTETSSTNAETAFNYAYDNLPVNGGLIYVKEGEYTVSDDINVSSNSTLKGNEGVKILYSTAITGFVVNNEEKVKFEDLTIDSQGNVNDTTHAIIVVDSEELVIDKVRTLDLFFNHISYLGCDNVTIKNTLCDSKTISSDNSYGIASRSRNTDFDETISRNITIENCEVANIRYNPIALYGVQNFTVANCYSYNAGHSAIAASAGWNGSIVGNRVENIDQQNSTSSADREAGIELEFKSQRLRDEDHPTSHDVSVQGNVCYDNEVGIFVRIDDAGSDSAVGTQTEPFNISITGNSVSGSRKEGIWLEDCEAVVVTSNNLRDNTDGDIVEGTSTTNTVIENNVTR